MILYLMLPIDQIILDAHLIIFLIIFQIFEILER